MTQTAIIPGTESDPLTGAILPNQNEAKEATSQSQSQIDIDIAGKPSDNSDAELLTELAKHNPKKVIKKQEQPSVETKVVIPDESVTDTQSVDPKIAVKEKLNKQFGIKKDEKTTTTDAPPLPVLPKEIEQELSYLRNLMKHPSVAAVLAAEKEGKNIFQITDELRGIDPEKASVSELFKIKLDRLGIKDEAKIEQALLAFNQKEEYEQAESVISTREQLRSERDKKLKDFISTTDQNSQKTQSLILQTKNDYDAILKSNIGKEVDGVVITPEIADTLNDITVWAQNGEQPVSAQELFELNLYHKYKGLIKQTIIDNSFAAGEEFVNSKITVTGKERTGFSKPNVSSESVKGKVDRMISNIDEAIKAQSV